MIVFADLHLREETEETVFGQVLPGILEAAKSDPNGRIAFLGDWWHVRYRVPIRLQNRVADWLRECQREEIRLTLLPGNHDQVDVAGENALQVFSNWNYVRVYTEPTWDRFGLWVPYRKRHEDISQALTLPPSADYRGAWRVLWMHHGVQGAAMNDHFEDTQGLPQDWFHRFLVFCGHYHKRQTMGTVTYVGSPYQTRADESGQDKGYAIWDPDTQVLQWVTTNWGKRYHRMRVGVGERPDLSGVAPGDEVRITAAPGAVVDEDLIKGDYTLVVTPESETQAPRLQTNADATVAQHAKAYVDEFHGDLDPNRLMAIYQDMTGAKA